MNVNTQSSPSTKATQLTITSESTDRKLPNLSTVIKVFIASPSDVQEERIIAREVVHEWNDLHADTSKTVLLPKAWETHASPATGAHPQTIINKEVLDAADMVVAMFWTRIGTRTETEVSGTVEEIKRHVASGKLAMIYFSSADVPMDNINHEQLSLLKDFKQWCRGKGLCWEYNSVTEFKELFRSHLVLRVRNSFPNADGNRKDKEERDSLSQNASQLIVAASSQNGYILRSSSRGHVLQVGGKQFGNPRDMKDAASWREAISELETKGLVAATDSRNTAYELTKKGKEMASELLVNGGDRS